jgi:hypothetical protein
MIITVAMIMIDIIMVGARRIDAAPAHDVRMRHSVQPSTSALAYGFPMRRCKSFMMSSEWYGSLGLGPKLKRS